MMVEVQLLKSKRSYDLTTYEETQITTSIYNKIMRILLSEQNIAFSYIYIYIY